jgi:hypothetical protein
MELSSAAQSAHRKLIVTIWIDVTSRASRNMLTIAA